VDPLREEKMVRLGNGTRSGRGAGVGPFEDGYDAKPGVELVNGPRRTE
jgi:hypothetical protein